MKNTNSSKDSLIFRAVIQGYLDTGSVKRAADLAGVSEVKARRILLTEGLWFSDNSIRVGHYFEQGLSSKEIAEKLHITVKAVQQYLPYSRGIYMGEDRSLDAVWSAEYRERIKTAQEKVLRRREDLAIYEGWEAVPEMREQNWDFLEELDPAGTDAFFDEDGRDIEDTLSGFEQYPGIVCLRELPEGKIDWRKAKARGEDIIRLHLELINENYSTHFEDDGHGGDENPAYDFSEEEKRVLRDYGGMKYGKTISRDLLVPESICLYALHYAIQACFGWENSHLHRFELPPRQYESVTDGKVGNWSRLVGVLFRSPYMEEHEQFWADDYETGSFKNWLRKKYTGPYVSLCHGEGIIQCTDDMKKYYRKNQLIEVMYSQDEGKLYVSDARPAAKGAKEGPLPVTEEDEKLWWRCPVVKKEVIRLEDCPLRVIDLLYADMFAHHLLERLSIGEVLALHGKSPEDDLSELDELMDTFDLFMDEDLKEDIAEIRRSRMDDPFEQPMIGAPTDVLYYYYDFGDNWKIRITGSMDACDLVEQGRITQEEIDEAIVKVYETYRPVCIAADGLSLVDDVGGIDGFISFLRSIHPTEEKAYWDKEDRPDNGPYESKQSSLVWAKSLGWKETVNVKRML